MPYGYGSANRGPSGPGPGGQGARGQATQNPGRAPAPTYQNVHQTGAVTQTPGRPPSTVTTGGGPPVTRGGPPSILNRPRTIPKGRTHPGGITGSNTWKNWIANNKWKAALSGLGGLTAGAGYQTLSDINKINQWAKIGYGARNPVPANMLSQLKGAWVPNKVFEKLGHGAGSLKGWLTGRVSPTHFGPVEAALTALTSPIGKLATRTAPGIGTAYTVGDLLAQRSEAMGTEANRISTLEGDEQTQAIEDYATKMYKPYARGGIVDLYRHGGF